MRFALILVLAFAGACTPKSLVGTPCKSAGDEQCDVNDDPHRLLRCDGSFFVAIADCANQCIEKDTAVEHTESTIDADETWACTDGPHHITVPLTVSAGVTLTIGEGAIIKLDPASRIDTDPAGRVDALGSDAAPILMTSSNGLKSGFGDNSDGGLNVFASTTQPSSVQNLVIERGIQGLGVFGLSANATAPDIENNTLRDNTNFGIVITCNEADAPIPDFKAAGNQFFANGGDIGACNQTGATGP